MPTPTSRLLQLLSLLQTRRDWPGTVLADRLDVSSRTVRRDVDRLRDLGYSIQATMGPEGGYRLDAGSELPPLLFDDDQVIALAVALRSATATGVGIEEAAVRALTTVRQVMPSRLRHRLDALEFTAVGPESPHVAPDVLLAVSTAIRADEVLRFDYPDSRDDVPPRRVEPHHLLTDRGRWYLVAWDLDRDDWRIFRADRMIPRTPTGPRFRRREVPGGNAAEYLSSRFTGADPGDRWPCHARVIVHRPAAEILPYIGDGIVEDLGHNRCSLETGSWSWVALAASLNRFDCAIEVVTPPLLIEAFALLATRNAATAAGSSRHPH